MWGCIFYSSLAGFIQHQAHITLAHIKTLAQETDHAVLGRAALRGKDALGRSQGNLRLGGAGLFPGGLSLRCDVRA